MEAGFPPLQVAAMAVCVLGALIAVAAAAFASRGFPIGLRRVARQLTDRVDAAEEDWTRTKGQLAVVVEELEELNESIERKRARIAASASQMKRQGGGEQPPVDDLEAQRQAIKQRARAAGYTGV